MIMEKSDLSSTSSGVIDPEIWAQLNQKDAPVEASKAAPAFVGRVIDAITEVLYITANDTFIIGPTESHCAASIGKLHRRE